MISRSIKVYQGGFFVVPVDDLLSALGLAARLPGNGLMFAYFFHMPKLEPQQLHAYLGALTASDSIWSALVSDMGINTSEWPAINVAINWNPQLWPLPKFKKVVPDLGLFWQVERSEENLEVVNESLADPGAVADLPESSVYGYRAATVELRRRLRGVAV